MELARLLARTALDSFLGAVRLGGLAEFEQVRMGESQTG